MATPGILILSVVSAESLAGSSGAGGDEWLEIVQPEWQALPEGGLFAWLQQQGLEFNLTTVSQYREAYLSQCQSDGALEVEIQIHRSRLDLEYKLVASYGELSAAPELGEGERNESQTINMEESLTIDRLISGEPTASWDGPVYSSSGEVLDPPPAIRYQGSGVFTWGQPVVGVIRLVYADSFDRYFLTIEPRAAGEFDPEKPDTAYQATVMAFWGVEQVEQHEVDLPDMSGNCSRDSGGVSVDPDDDDGEPCVRHVIIVDPCTKEVIREFDEPMTCPEEEAEA